MPASADNMSKIRRRAKQAAADDSRPRALAGLIRSAKVRGVSGRTVLDLYRDAGGRIRTATFWELWRTS